MSMGLGSPLEETPVYTFSKEFLAKEWEILSAIFRFVLFEFLMCVYITFNMIKFKSN